MRPSNSIKRSLSIFFCAMLFAVCLYTPRTMSQTVWVVCTWDTSSSYKQKDGKEKFERRFYVTDLIETTKDIYLAARQGIPRIEEACGNYLEKTVYQAATERGERLESGTLKVLKSIDNTDDGYGFKFASKEEIEKQRADMIKEAQSFGRQILSFNWDITNANASADLAREQKRIPPGIAAPPTQATAKTASSAASTQTTANKSTAPANYIFGWARIVTTVEDLDKHFTINRAYYSNILALPTNADANALKGQVSTYFNQLGPAYALKVNEKVLVKDATVKTFPTVYEADNARYAMATQDREKLNANSEREVALPISYFTWNYYGSRHELFPNISEFVTTGYDSSWEFVTFEVTAEKQIGGETVHETRYYVSYPYELFMTGTESINLKKHLDEYFTKTVVEPAARRGVKISYYDSDIEMPTISYNTFAEAWAKRNERVDVFKSNEYPQYDFLIISNGPNKGEGTSFPYCVANCTGERARITASK